MSSYYPRSKDLTRTRKSLTDSPPSSPSPTDKNYRVRPGAFLLETHSFLSLRSDLSKRVPQRDLIHFILLVSASYILADLV